MGQIALAAIWNPSCSTVDRLRHVDGRVSGELSMLKTSVVAALLLGLSAAPALGSPITITTSGTTSGGAVSGSAVFTFSGTSLTIALQNTTATWGSVASVLDGLSFTYTGGAGLTLTGVSSPSNFMDCSSGTCVASSTFTDYDAKPNPATIGSPYTWGLNSTGIYAGNGSLKPGGIVNSSVAPISSISNQQHNDFLVSAPGSPVTFTFTDTTTITGITGITFRWGTSNEGTPGTTCSTDVCLPLPPAGDAPEPGSLVLLGSGLLAGAALLRRRFLA